MTTIDAAGVVNIAPMGPIVDADMQQLILRPYQTSTTYANLKRHGRGVFHVTDNVAMLARAAIGVLDPLPELREVEGVEGLVLTDACRWVAVEVTALDDREERTEIVMRVIAQGRQRDFFGLCRAKHAVVEAAILATRIDFLPAEQIQKEYESLAVLVEKTGGVDERDAFAMLCEYVQARREPSGEEAGG